jgi:hypothetical protein
MKGKNCIKKRLLEQMRLIKKIKNNISQMLFKTEIRETGVINESS